MILCFGILLISIQGLANDHLIFLIVEAITGWHFNFSYRLPTLTTFRRPTKKLRATEATKVFICCFGDIILDNCRKILNIARTLRYPPLWGAIMPGLSGDTCTLGTYNRYRTKIPRGYAKTSTQSCTMQVQHYQGWQASRSKVLCCYEGLLQQAYHLTQDNGSPLNWTRFCSISIQPLVDESPANICQRHK